MVLTNLGDFPPLQEDTPAPQYHLVRPLIALPPEVYPQHKNRPYYFLTSLDVKQPAVRN